MSDNSTCLQLLYEKEISPIVGARLIVNADILAWANVRVVSLDFEKDFFGKNEENLTQSMIRVHRLIGSSRDSDIISNLGGRNKITMAHFLGLLWAQNRGQGEGPLSVNGRMNLGYVPNKEKKLRAVSFWWDINKMEWRATSSSIYGPTWEENTRVVSMDLIA
ncbi:MAG: hypothetical protein WAW90_01200 [Minisyncoccia bacterium]